MSRPILPTGWSTIGCWLLISTQYPGLLLPGFVAVLATRWARWAWLMQSVGTIALFFLGCPWPVSLAVGYALWRPGYLSDVLLLVAYTSYGSSVGIYALGIWAFSHCPRDAVRPAVFLVVLMGLGWLAPVAMNSRQISPMVRNASIERDSLYEEFLDPAEPPVEENEVVARVIHGKTQRLREAAWSEYRNGRWLATPESMTTIETQPGLSDLEIIFPANRPILWPFGSQLISADHELSVSSTGKILDKGPLATKWRIGAIVDWAPSSPPPVRLDQEKHFLDPKLISFARNAVGDSTGEQAVRKLDQAIRATAVYQKDLGVVSGDPHLGLLFENKAGNCKQFASTLALLAREVDVPSRLITGYIGGEAEGEQWVFRGTDRHAWVEYWNGVVWKSIDPTPATGLTRSFGRQWMGGIGLVVWVLMMYLAWKRHSRPENSRSQDPWRLVLRKLHRKGWYPPTDLPPLSQARWLIKQIGSQAEPVEELAWIFYRYRYANSPLVDMQHLLDCIDSIPDAVHASSR